jgi:hypothetical protein
MQTELDADYPQLDIQVLGVNWAKLESANSEMVVGKSLPWLQDVDSDEDGRSDVWAEWGTEHLDLVVLDARNELAVKTTLTSYSLESPANYAGLRDALIDLAMTENQKPWHHAEAPLDVDGNGYVAPLDALIIINRLNSAGSQTLPKPTGSQVPPPYYDTNRDGRLEPVDALLVINFLNDPSRSAGGEGEPLMPVRELIVDKADANSLSQDRPATGASSIRSQEGIAGASYGLAPPSPGEEKPGRAALPRQADIVFSADPKDWLPSLFAPWKADLLELDLHPLS